jgi:hypothetical protein
MLSTDEVLQPYFFMDCRLMDISGVEPWRDCIHIADALPLIL